MELGGIPIATILSQITAKPCLYVRKQLKTYGTMNLIEGGYKEEERAVVIEDVITTAGQVSRSVKEMRVAGLVVDQVICVIDRQEGGKEALSEIGCELSSVFTKEELGYET